jgi:hypothetical protein
VARSFQKLSHQTLGGLGITVALHQHVENETILIDGTPQPVPLAANGFSESKSNRFANPGLRVRGLVR